MFEPKRSTDNVRAYRKRLRAAGSNEVLFRLPQATIDMLDEFKERQRLRSRSQALLQLIEQGRDAIQKTN